MTTITPISRAREAARRHWAKGSADPAAHPANQDSEGKAPRAPRRAPMSLALGLVLGSFVLVAVVSVMGVGIWSGYTSTVDLMGQKAEVLLSAAEAQTRQYLDAAENQVGFIVDMIVAGEIEPGANEEFVSLLFGALAAAPQIEAIWHVSPDYRLVGAERDEAGARPLFMRVAEDRKIVEALRAARRGAQGRWTGLVWREEYGQALLSFEQPVMVDGSFAGLLVALISVRTLSEFIADLETEFGNNAFVLYGQDQVLAHALMAYGYPGLTGMNPLPRQAAFSDPVLSSMWEEDRDVFLESEILSRAGGHAVRLGEDVYAFLRREVSGYGDRPLIVGTYFRSADLTSEVMRLKWAVIVCLLILLASVAAAAITGKRITLPVRRLAEGARRVHALDLANVPQIPGSFFKEIDQASQSFNAMLDGLRWFERYVPKTLVTRLMHTQDGAAVESSERVVTVMFTDIVGFTRLSETLSAPEVAALLNEHFTLLAACIEAEGGTVDKFIGDSVMAMWGAPERYADGPDRACRAALAIETAMRAWNEDRRLADQPVIRVRIGLHTGPVVVGNIGSPGRVNYTVVGDTVNTAKRLDELGRIAGAGADGTRILLSGETAAALRAAMPLVNLGLKRLRGRSTPVEVFSLSSSTPRICSTAA
jgi:class 3 adenylate cyclase